MLDQVAEVLKIMDGTFLIKFSTIFVSINVLDCKLDFKFY